VCVYIYICCVAATQRGPWPLYMLEVSRSQRRVTAGRTYLDEWSARRWDLYLTTHNTHNRQTSMPPSGIRTRNTSKRAASDPRLRPQCHWDRLYNIILIINTIVVNVYYCVCCMQKTDRSNILNMYTDIAKMYSLHSR